MSHGGATSSIELSGATRHFDRVARKWNVDYAFYKTEPGKYLLFFKSNQGDHSFHGAEPDYIIYHFRELVNAINYIHLQEEKKNG